MSGPSDNLLVDLQRVGRIDLGDFLSFLVLAGEEGTWNPHTWVWHEAKK